MTFTDTFRQLQSRHEELLKLLEDEAEVLPEVQAYIRAVRSESSRVTEAQDRDQLRANLRYWASFVHESTGVYPSTDLAPAEASRIQWWNIGRWPIGLILIMLILTVKHSLCKRQDGGILAACRVNA